MTLQIRAEFQNIFNRLFYAVPADQVGIFGQPTVNPATAAAHGNSLGATSGLLSGGYGFVNWVNGGQGTEGAAQPRSGQLVARFTF
jgi:hypothetical protein